MKPVLLLIPGMFNTADVWKPVSTLLGPLVDIRIADVLTQDSIAAMAQDAWQLVADLPAGARLTICGFSMGGYVAIELLAAHADRVHAVAFVDTSARTETAEGLALREKVIAALERNFDRTVDKLVPFNLHSRHHTGPLENDLRAMMHAVGAQSAIRQNRIQRKDHRGVLAQLRIPTLVVCGRDDQVTPPALSEDLAALIPGARLEWLDDAGHMTPLEQPEALAQLLQALVHEAR